MTIHVKTNSFFANKIRLHGKNQKLQKKYSNTIGIFMTEIFKEDNKSVVSEINEFDVVDLSNYLFFGFLGL